MQSAINVHSTFGMISNRQPSYMRGVLRDNSRGLARLHRPEINPSTLARVQYASAAGSNKGNLEGIKQST